MQNGEAEKPRDADVREIGGAFELRREGDSNTKNLLWVAKTKSNMEVETLEDPN